MNITKHAYKKAKQVFGLNKSGIENLFRKALSSGLMHGDTKGHLQKWINSRYFVNETANNMRVYGEYLFIVNDKTVITLYILPNNLKKLAKKLIEQRDK